MILVKTMQGSTQISVITQETSTVSIDIDPSMYESFPTRTGKFTKIDSSEEVDGQGRTIILETWRENISGQIDPRYVPPEEWYMYDIYFDPGQGPDTHYSKATYGVAVGYRALAGAYHTLSLGHYARAYRPHAVAVGPSTHIKSEGGIGLGYSNNIDSGSPFSLAIGSRVKIDSGMTNAIVIGVPKINFSKRFKEGYKDSKSPQIYTSNPKAMKPNSINFVFNGDGLKDVFVDDIPMSDRMATEVKVIGNTSGGKGAQSNIIQQVNQVVGIPQDDKSIVLFSGNGVKIFTQNYIDNMDEMDMEVNQTHTRPEAYGDTSQIEINGKPLSEILAENSGRGFDDYRASVSNAAIQAMNSVSNATNFTQVKTALMNFFESIK